jgi:molybdopterin-guanine dinucleotide biosynthesis protein B
MSEIKVEINGNPLELNSFAQKVVISTIKGLLSPLRGYEKGNILIVIKNGGDTEI